MSGQKMAPVGAGAGDKGTSTVTTGSPMSRSMDLLRDYGAILGMLGALLVFGILEPAVLTPANLASVVDQSSSLVILAVGLAIVMMMRGVDLSVAQVSDAAGLIAAMLLVRDQPLLLVFLLPLAFGVLIGGVNGLLMAYLGVPAIIGTLGMMFIVRTFELIISSGREAQILFTLPPEQSAPFFFIGQGTIGPVSTSVIIAAAVVAVGYVLTNATALGRYISAVGGNVRAAFLAGVSHRLVFATGFIISALFVGLIGNALTLMGLGVPYRYMAYGVVILVAMAIGVLRRRD